MPLFRAHLLTQTLATILDLRDPVAAQQSIDEWLAWAARARLKPFVRVARTIREHLDGILGYIRTGLSNGRSEGMNGKVRVVTRRAFGFHSASSLIAMLHLCCAGLHLTPRHVRVHGVARMRAGVWRPRRLASMVSRRNSSV